MSLTAEQIARVVEEVAPLVAGGAVQRVLAGSERAVVLKVRAPGRSLNLLLGLEEGAARLHLVPRPPRQPPSPSGFITLLRKRAVGARVIGLVQAPGDRVVRLEVERPPERLTLLAELTGRHGNVFLLDREGVILGSLLPNRSYRRKLVPGEPYEPPAPPPGRAAAALRGDPLDLGRLAADGRRSERVREHYEAMLGRAAREGAARDLLRRLRREEAALERRRESVEADRRRALEAQELRRRGELLRAAHGKVARGATAVEVPDYYAEGAPPVSIPLDPALDLAGNIERCFSRYRKYRDALPRIEARLEETARRREEVREALERAEGLAGVASPDEIEALARELEEAGALRPPSPAARKEVAAARAVPYREFTSASGKTILVGKGGRHNDALTLRIARGSDLWLHARDRAGAHVVVRLARGEEVDEETLLDAATLAAHHSKARGAAKVEVLYTRAKHVTKPKGFPPGQVSVAASKTILVRLEPARLQRLKWGHS